VVNGSEREGILPESGSPGAETIENEPAKVRLQMTWAWFKWLNVYSNQGSRPANPMQDQTLGRLPEVAAQAERNTPGVASGITSMLRTQACIPREFGI